MAKFNTEYSHLLTAGDGTGRRPTTITVNGDGTKKSPYYIMGARFAGETTKVINILEFALNNGVHEVRIAYSGCPWVYQDGSWARRATTCSSLEKEIEETTQPVPM
jgi:hypothetical protein